MSDKLHLSIVSPNKHIATCDSDMVLLPSIEGDMGVMAGHTAMIVSLKAGTIVVYDGDKITHNFIVHSGFAEITPTQCTILAQAAIDGQDVSSTSIEEAQFLANDTQDDGDAAYAHAQESFIEHPVYK